ncbi:alpha/beta hydrolase [Demequina soli]|uniref:alpha/beta hydrolase n=1 Tax=Demequina soli TaxID=1638987 RepID=UPI0007834E40|nr:alpha/beta hydrolase [Demequina soli]
MIPDTQHLPARDIPWPASVSQAARDTLALGGLGQAVPWPALDDANGWRRLIAIMNEAAASMQVTVPAGAITPVATEIAGVPAFLCTPEESSMRADAVVLHVHGGAWIQGGGAACGTGGASRAEGWAAPVIAVDYRMPPDHPFPAALDDCLAVYRALLDDRDASDILVSGESSGGSIAGALMHRLRAEGLPMPAGLLLDTPATDLTCSGDSMVVNDGLDQALTGDFQPTMALYAGGHDARDPLVSPLYGDHRGFPRTLLLTGTRDRMLSDVVRLHGALLDADVDSQLRVFEAQGHAGFLGRAPEDAERVAAARRFVAALLGG